MNKVIEIIKKRRSIRSYSEKTIGTAELLKMADAGRYAPTARNDQPWEFVIVKDREKLRRIADITDYGKFISGAAALIGVFSKDTKYYLEDCSAATQNIMLAATSMGIGSCWVAGDKKPYCEELRKLLKVPSKYKLVSLISLGYPKNKKSFRSIAKRPLNGICHFEKF